MTPIPEKSLGTAAPIFLGLIFLFWLLMLGSIATWFGRTPVPGRETDRVVAQAYSAGLALFLWIFLAALTLIGNSKQVLPDWFGTAAWIVIPISCAGSLAAIMVLFEPQRRWPLAIPALAPVLLAGFVLYAFFPSGLSVAKVGSALCVVLLALSFSILPVAVGFVRIHGDSGSIDATPGPKLDKWMAEQSANRRTRELEELSKFDDETKLYEFQGYLHPDSPTRQEALELIRHLPNRQADAMMALQNSQDSLINYFSEFDLQPTPELCTATRRYLRDAVRHRQSQPDQSPNSFVGVEFSEGIKTIEWISKNCGCNEELDLIEAYARAQQQDAPEVQKFLAAILAIKEQRQ